jgi:predicted dehydrogenase
VRLRHFDYTSTIFINPHAKSYERACYSFDGEEWRFDQSKNDQAYKDELQAFLAVCQGESWDPRLCGAAEAAHVVRIIAAAKQSAMECKVVTI